MILKHYIVLFIGAGLMACSAVNTITVESDSVAVTDTYANPNRIDSIVAPYKLGMDAIMDSVIAFSPNDFTKGRPSGSLNNWSADVILSETLKLYPKSGPVFCLLNLGGLRNPISKGGVTVGDIYKLMPFDNEIVMVEMPLSTIQDIEVYLKKSGGEPIAGAKLVEGKLKLDGTDKNTKSYWIVTSDYLMNGGDKMTFFEKRLSEDFAGVLMRDAMLDAAKSQDTLIWNDENRISF
ncbi:MAG: 2',3'-cyclic-nucleotide 2'-phosphodiesterase (5'-nucleotidase family) [Crocinitomicaceae bacterium]|jgi:2',3'-cyclic-nucleotide 2'-phosphodiesterase (5'-nucleotidase family)